MGYMDKSADYPASIFSFTVCKNLWSGQERLAKSGQDSGISISSVPDPDPNPDPPEPHVLGLPDPDPLVRGMDPNLSISKQK
jgi:hypothetical protein